MLNFFFLFLLGGRKIHPFYRAIINRAVSLGYALPSYPVQIKQNQLVYDLVAAGIWAKLDGFWNFYHDGAKAFSFINWINPTSFVATESGTVTFSSLDGIKSGGADYLDTGWSEVTNGINWLLGDSSYMIDIKESAQEAAYICGAQDGSSQFSRFRSRSAADQIGVRIDHQNNENTTASTDGSGVWFIRRLANAVQVWRNGSLFASYTNTVAAAKVTGTHNVLRTNAPAATVSAKTVRAYAVGASLNGLENAFYTIFNTYKT